MVGTKLKLEGERYGRWTVLSIHEPAPRGYWRWWCKCDCGSVKSVNARTLRNGTSQSCGCLQEESIFKHGMSHSRTFKSWDSMKGRCNNPNDVSFARYGGRGIKICDRWQNDFLAFLEDMGERPANKTLDRIDSSGDYTPENCRWASPKEQVINRKCTVHMTVNGVTKTRDEWCDETGLSRTTIVSRIAAGWSSEKAILTPARTKSPNGTGRPRQQLR